MRPTIDYQQILARYWDLANLDAESTKGSITGQLKALELLCEELRVVKAEPAKPQMYTSAWMTEK